MDPDAVTGHTARQLWAEFDGVERLAAAGKTLLARRVADTYRRDHTGTGNAAQELARRAGTTTKAPRDALDTSARLADLPEVDAAIRRGELSPAQAELISDDAAANPDAGPALVALARRTSLPELRDECQRVKAAADPDPDATHTRIHQRRYLRRYTDREGGWNLIARGTTEQGAAFNTALDPIIDEIFHTARRHGRNERHEAYAFDALIGMADRATGRPDSNPTRPDQTTGPSGGSHDPDTTSDTNPDPADGPTAAAETGDPPAGSGARPMPTRPPAPGPRAGSPNPRYLALLRADVEALRRGHTQGQELCEITGIGPIPVPVARDLLGDAILKPVITSGVDVLNVTHLGRGPTAAQRAALLWASPTCAVEGCHRTRVEYDHREDYARTRHTRLDELDPLCQLHHDLKTHHG